MICPCTDKICTDEECRQNGCLEQQDEDGHEIKRKDADSSVK